ncbi:MAG: Lrp/AsnC ligand binding domain-containing protein [Candidatus Bathyarchaeota archaeon]
MVEAFFIVTVKAGTDQEVIRKLKSYKEINVKEVYEVYGAFDILARIEAESEDKISEVRLNLEENKDVWAIQVVKVCFEWRKAKS